MKMTSFQFENHRRLPISSEYTLEGLYPNSLYHIWIAARSKRGEGATTPPIAVRTEQYGRYHTDTRLCVSLYVCIRLQAHFVTNIPMSKLPS